jgi:type VI protein secretion system component VasK
MATPKKFKLTTIIKTSLVTAFTFATALIWKDAMLKIIENYVPAQKVVQYILVTAFLATVILISLIYIFLQTEREAEIVLQKIIKHKKKK